MANGTGGLIWIGVETDGHDTPLRWPTLKVGQLRLQAIESQVRNFVEPYVPVELGIAASPQGNGEIALVRVPEALSKPVFVADRGILIREGEASVPASVAAIRSWLLAEMREPNPSLADFAHYVTESVQSDPPVLNIGVYPLRAWYASSWNDVTDDRITQVVRSSFPLLSLRTVSDDLLDFRLIHEPNAVTEWAWFKPTGSVLRRNHPKMTADGRVAISSIASVVGRTWAMAQAAILALLPGYVGPLAAGIAIGTVQAGFSSVDVGDVWLDRAEHRPRDGRRSWAKWFEYELGAEPGAVVGTSLAGMLRGFGYSGAERVVRRVVDQAPWA